MKKYHLLVLFLICFSFFKSYGQEEIKNKQSHFWKQVQFGGGIGLSFSDNFFSG